MLTPLVIAAVVGYFLGALPFGYWVARAKGINIFEHGSKNPGATNVRRVLGKGPGNLVFFLDALKGAVAASWPLLFRWRELQEVLAFGTREVNQSFRIEQIYPAAAVIGLVAALIGHSFSIFTEFRGGKGVATSVGGLLVIMPVVVLIAAVVWAATFFTSRYVSLASILAAISLPISAFLLHEPPLLVGVSVVIAVFVVLRHRANVGRLLKGTENKFVKKTEPPK